jgi:hypothetical protein
MTMVRCRIIGVRPARQISGRRATSLARRGVTSAHRLFSRTYYDVCPSRAMKNSPAAQEPWRGELRG